MGIRPNGTIPLRGERPSSGSTRPFELSSGVFYYAQSGSRDSLAQYAVRSAIGNTKNLQVKPIIQHIGAFGVFFVLTKGMSVVGPRPALPNEVATYNDYQRQRLLVKPGMTCYWQTRRNRDSITFDEWVDLDLWRARPVRRYAGACMLCCRQPAG